MKHITLILVLVLLGRGLPPAAGDEQPPKDKKKYAPMPWHLVDTWWDIGQENPFESLAVDVTISDDVPSSVNLYISPIGLGHLSKTPFYGGIQTQADGYTKNDPKLRPIGPGFLFSMWGERSHDAIRPSDGGFLQSSGDEGDFVSVGRQFAWIERVGAQFVDHRISLPVWRRPRRRRLRRRPSCRRRGGRVQAR